MREHSDRETTKNIMAKWLKRRDHDEWTSEAGGVRGVILKKIMSDFCLQEMHHAAKIEPPYIIES